MKYDFEIVGDIGYGFGSKAYVAQKLNESKGKALNVRINSLGGSVDDALDIVARLQEHGDVTLHVKGMCASAATVIMMGAKKVCMDKNALLLIHNCLNVVWELGWMNANEIKEAMERMAKQAEDQEVIDRVIATMYANKCGKEFDEIKKVMDRGGWLTADECLEMGLVDELTDTEGQKGRKAAMAARADFSELQMAYNLPDLPAITATQQVMAVVDNINDKMKELFNKVLALLGCEAMTVADGAQATEEQMQSALDSASAAITKMIDERDVAIAAKDAMEANRQQAIDDAVATARAEMQQQLDANATEIENLKAQIEALQAAPAAQQQEPAAGQQQQEPANATIVDGKSAAELFAMLP